MKFRNLTITGLLGLFFIAYSTVAAENFERSGLWGGGDIGGGYVQRELFGIEEDGGQFFMGVKGGYALNPHFLTGLELSGWLFEESDISDSSEGEGLMQVFLINRFYPSLDSGLFAKVGGGYVSHWNNRPGKPIRKNGYGLTFGGGYDFPFTDGLAITPILSYSFGEAEDLKHEAITFSIGLTFP